jgi:hypothetical protein
MQRSGRVSLQISVVVATNASSYYCSILLLQKKSARDRGQCGMQRSCRKFVAKKNTQKKKKALETEVSTVCNVVVANL